MINPRFKFRAWCKGDFDTSDGPLLFEMREIDDQLWFAHDDELKYPFEIPFLDDFWIIEQWTGNVDEHGREIFAGDIIYFQGRTGIIEMLPAGFQIFYPELGDTETGSYDPLEWYDTTNEGFNVIDNIHMREFNDPISKIERRVLIDELKTIKEFGIDL